MNICVRSTANTILELLRFEQKHFIWFYSVYTRLSSVQHKLLQSGGSGGLPKQEVNLSRYNGFSSLHLSTDEEKQIYLLATSAAQ